MSWRREHRERRDPFDLNPPKRGGTRKHSASPRALGTNPRALGTNPRMGTPAETARVERIRTRAYRLLHAAGVWLCDECSDTKYGHGEPCTCRVLSIADAEAVITILRHAGDIGPMRAEALATWRAMAPYP